MQVRGRCRRTSTDRDPTFPAQPAAPRAPVHLLTVMRTAIQFPAGNVLMANKSAGCEIVCQEENRLIRTGGRFG